MCLKPSTCDDVWRVESPPVAQIKLPLKHKSNLLKNKFIRAAGAMCGVVLEGHLKSVCIQHEIKITKKDDLSKYNDYLKNCGIIKQTSWRKIQYLTDIRNSCDHKRDVEPTADQVLELINGTKQIIAEVA